MNEQKLLFSAKRFVTVSMLFVRQREWSALGSGVLQRMGFKYQEKQHGRKNMDNHNGCTSFHVDSVFGDLWPAMVVAVSKRNPRRTATTRNV